MADAAGPNAGEQKLLDSIFPVSRETITRLTSYRSLLQAWQAKTNLVAPNTLAQFWVRHVADSLQVKALRPQARHFADLGSGGGFPGMVIAICNGDDPQSSQQLLERSQKKCAFLRSVAIATGARCQIHCERIESAAKQIMQSAITPQIVTARALAPLVKLLDLAEPLLAQGATALFHKGREYRGELEECRGLWQFDLVVHESKIEAGSVLLEIREPKRNHR